MSARVRPEERSDSSNCSSVLMPYCCFKRPTASLSSASLTVMPRRSARSLMRSSLISSLVRLLRRFLASRAALRRPARSGRSRRKVSRRRRSYCVRVMMRSPTRTTMPSRSSAAEGRHGGERTKCGQDDFFHSFAQVETCSGKNKFRGGLFVLGHREAAGVLEGKAAGEDGDGHVAPALATIWFMRSRMASSRRRVGMIGAAACGSSMPAGRRSST